VGYGDRDLDLHRCDPLLLTGLLRALEPTGTPVMLLHNYPYHRQAGYLAQVFPHVYADVGLITHNAGHRASAVLAEALELAPYGKFLFSSDAYGLPEFYYLGALLFRRALDDFFREWPAATPMKAMIGAANARRVYRLDDQ
jgi:predicted TIM-barrel fold metal-dependent hydrolase